MNIRSTLNPTELMPLAARIPRVSENLNFQDRLGALKMRFGIGRDNYMVAPGLYKIGSPDSQSDVFVSANYKLSFDMLRKNLNSLNVWILVVDTKGVNVWCAAGKGNFGTENVVKSIKNTSLENIVKHRRIIVPQLAASGIAAHKVKDMTGFKVLFGPVLAKDIKPFIESGFKATPEMRKVLFPMKERAKLIPVDVMYGKYKLLIILASFFVFSGLDRTGFLFEKMLGTSFFPLINIFCAYLAGIVLAPLFLSWVPVRTFALKGAFWGLLITVLLNFIFQKSIVDSLPIGFVNLSIASFMAMNFTGSSTYTSLSGVQKEMEWAIPFQIGFMAVGCLLFIILKLI